MWFMGAIALGIWINLIICVAARQKPPPPRRTNHFEGPAEIVVGFFSLFLT